MSSVWEFPLCFHTKAEGRGRRLLMKELKIGILQQHNVADARTNMKRLAEGIADLAHRGAELVILQELQNSLYFCQTESVENFDLAEPIPGPSTDFYGNLACELGVVIVTSLFEKRAPGLYHNTAVVIEKTAALQASTGRCTSRMIRPTMRSFTSRRATLVFILSTRVRDGWAYSSAGTSGILRQPG